jgi:hypothetical protein
VVATGRDRPKRRQVAALQRVEQFSRSLKKRRFISSKRVNS